MAEVKNNIVTQGASGTLGGMIVFRQINGKTIMSVKPKKSEKKLTEKQLEQRARFQEAVVYGKSAVSNADQKAEYEAGKGEKFNSAYHVAVADFLNAPNISNIDFGKYTGKVGDIIIIRVTDDFKVSEVKVSICNPDGSMVEEGNAVMGVNGLDWIYTATKKNESLEGDRISIKAYDMPRNETVHEQQL